MVNRELREGLHRRLIEYLFRVKVIVALVLLTFLVFFHYFRYLGIETLPVILSLIVEMCVFLLYFNVRAKKPEWVIPYNVLSLWIDVLAVTVALHFFGGLYSMIWAADYFLLIAIASAFLSRGGRLLFATCVAVVYSVLCYLEHNGIVARHNIFGIPVSDHLDLFCWLSTMALLSVTTLISYNFMDVFSRLHRFADLGRFSTELAHEIRTPLQIIEGVTHRGECSPTAQAEIKTQIGRISRFVKEILALGREERQRPSKTRLQDIVDYAVDLVFKASPVDQRIHLRKEYTDEELWVHVDIDQISKAFSNLIRNGIDSIEAEGEIRVVVCRHGFEWVQVEVCDTGVGIHESEKKRIFEPFYTTKTGMRGVGLGLAIAKKFIDANGGDIEVESKVHRGSRFIVRLPLHAEPEQV